MGDLIIPVVAFVFGAVLAANIRGVGRLVGGQFRFRLRRWGVQPGDARTIVAGRVLGTFICALSAMGGAGQVLVGAAGAPGGFDDVLIISAGAAGIAIGAVAWRLTRPGGRLEQFASGEVRPR